MHTEKERKNREEKKKMKSLVWILFLIFPTAYNPTGCFVCDTSLNPSGDINQKKKGKKICKLMLHLHIVVRYFVFISLLTLSYFSLFLFAFSAKTIELFSIVISHHCFSRIFNLKLMFSFIAFFFFGKILVDHQWIYFLLLLKIWSSFCFGKK